MVERDSAEIAELRRHILAARDDVPRVEASLQLVSALRRARRFAEALEVAQGVPEHAARAGAADGAARLALLVGELLADLHRDDEAALRLAEARHALDATDAGSRLIVRCERLLADVARRRGRYDEAERWLGSARKRYEEAGLPRAAASCEHDLGTLRHAMGDVPGSIAALRAARSALLDLRDREGVASCGFNLGVALHDVGAHDDAVEHYQQARTIFEAVRRSEDAAGCDQNIAAVLFVTGRTEEAGQRLMVAQAAYRKLGLARRVAECDADLAQVLRAAGRAEGAMAYLARARSEGVGDPADTASASA